MNSIKLSILIFSLSLYFTNIYSQTRLVTGTVYDGTDLFPIPGASVVVEGTFLGGTTDFDGQFSINIPDSLHVLVVSFIGLRSQTIDISGKTEISVTLEADVVGLDEIVVTVPYSKQSKDTYTGSVTVIRTNQMQNGAPESVDKVLQGNAPGVLANSPSGQPGSQAEVRLRGTGSLSAGSSPLYIIDGVPVNSDKLTSLSDNGNALSSLNPSDIASISILKDASATSLYGSRASNGVIMITTKQGKKGATKYSFSTQQGISQITNPSFSLLNSTEYVSWKKQAMINSGYSDAQILRELDSDTINTNWLEEVYRKGYNQNYEFSASGGSDNTTFYVSGKYRKDEGIVIGTDFNTISARSNISHKASDKLEFGTRASISLSTQNGTPKGGELADPVTAAYILRPTLPVYGEEGEYYFENQTYNPVGIMDLDINESRTNRFSGNAYAQYTIIENLQFKSIFSADLINIEEFKFQHPETPDGMNLDGIGSIATAKILDVTSSNTISYERKIGENQNISALAGYEVQSNKLTTSKTSASNFASADKTLLSTASNPIVSSSGKELSRIISYISTGQYSLMGKYYISGSFRRDGSSKFSPNNQFANFWSTGVSWRISEESFFENAENINSLKLRASYGTSGNSDIRNYAYASLFEYGANYNGLPGGFPATFGNDNLTWERNANADIGIDMRLFKRFSATVEVYHRRTFDLLLDVPVSMTTGYSSQLQNVGEMVNKGIECSLGAEVIKREQFSWSIDFNISHNMNKIIKLYEGQDIITGAQIQREGETFNSFYLADWAGVDARTGEPLWLDTLGNVTKVYASAARHIAGNPDPIFTSGITNSFSYRNVDLSFLVFISYGNKIYNNLNRALLSDGAIINNNQVPQALEYWTEMGEVVSVPKPIINNPSSSNASSDRYLEDGSYVRLKNVSIGYTIANSRFRDGWKGSMRVYGQATNVLTFTNYSGIDPEQNLRGVEFFSYPNARSFSLGINLSF